MDVKFLKDNNESELRILRNKLRSSLESLKYDLEHELIRLDKEKNNYLPSNDLGVVQSQGNKIDNLIGKIHSLCDTKKMIEMLEKEDDK